MTKDVDAKLTSAENASPAFWFKTITFSGGETVSMEPGAVTLIVGPNNSGKTTCLNEIQEWLRRGGYYYTSKDYPDDPALLVVKDLGVEKSGSHEDVTAWLKETVALCHTNPYETKLSFAWLGAGCLPSDVKPSWEHQRLGALTYLLCSIVDVENRLEISKPQDCLESLVEAPKHPVHALSRDDKLEIKLSHFFDEAFHSDLILRRAGGKKIALHVGSRSELGSSSDRAAPEYLKRLARYPELEKMGHGMRSFAGCLLSVLTDPALVLLIDEPEVFLHPPHARMLGHMLAREKRPSRQLIISTHSADFLRGVIDSERTNINVIRLTREDGANHAHQLGTHQIRKLWTDPILRYSNVFDGLFHDLIVVCEGDGDCRFYSALADIAQAKARARCNVMFTWANGKHRVQTIVQALHALRVPTVAIVDFDIFNEEMPIAKLVEAKDGDWKSFRADWEFVRQSIESKFPRPSPDVIRKSIEEVLVTETNTYLSEKGAEKIKHRLKAISPWSLAKQSGIAVVPNGQPTQRLATLLKQLKSLGIFVVECGELEQFVRSVGKEGPKWVSEVLSTKDIATDPELEAAREFIANVLSYRSTRNPLKTAAESPLAKSPFNPSHMTKPEGEPKQEDRIIPEAHVSSALPHAETRKNMFRKIFGG